VLILLDTTITGWIVHWEDFLRELSNGCTDKRFQNNHLLPKCRRPPTTRSIGSNHMARDMNNNAKIRKKRANSPEPMTKRASA
jgi:hypothetical protein